MKKIVFGFLIFITSYFSVSAFDEGTYEGNTNEFFTVTSTNIEAYRDGVFHSNLPSYPGTNIINADFVFIKDEDNPNSNGKFSVIYGIGTTYYFASQTGDYDRWYNSTDRKIYKTSHGTPTYDQKYCIKTSGGDKADYTGNSEYFGSLGCSTDTGLLFTGNLVFENQILTSGNPQTCELIDTPFITPFSLKPTHESEIINIDYGVDFNGDGNLVDVLHTDEVGIFFYNVKNLTNFDTGLIDETIDIEFKSTSWRGPKPQLHIVRKDGGTLTNFKLFSEYDDLIVSFYDLDYKLLNEYEYDGSLVTTDPAKYIVVEFPSIFYFSTYKVSNIIFGEYQETIIQKEFCTDDVTGENFLDGELFDGDKEEAETRKNINSIEETNEENINGCTTGLNFSPTCIKNTVESKVTKIFKATFELFNVFIPTTVPELSFQIPVPRLNSDFQIYSTTETAIIPPIEDKLNVSQLERSEIGVVFITFIIATVFIITKLTLIGFLFILILILTKFSRTVIKSTFGIDFTSQTLQGNVISMSILLILIVSMQVLLGTVFIVSLDIIPFINICSNISETFFMFLANTVGGYTYFALIVNTFFGAITGYIVIYTTLYLVSLFGRLQ